MNYCLDGIHVHNSAHFLQGHYEIQQIDVNDRPYFKMEMGALAIWWSNGYWFISTVSYKGQAMGFAFYKTDEYCPNQLTETYWIITSHYGDDLRSPDDFLGSVAGTLHISCKYISTIKSRYVCPRGVMKKSLPGVNFFH